MKYTISLIILLLSNVVSGQSTRKIVKTDAINFNYEARCGPLYEKQ
jgi:hypothetical protein